MALKCLEMLSAIGMGKKVSNGISVWIDDVLLGFLYVGHAFQIGECNFEEYDDHIVIGEETFQKPFVEKPVDAEDHNIHIYYPSSAGGGCQKLFRKVSQSIWAKSVPR